MSVKNTINVTEGKAVVVSKVKVGDEIGIGDVAYKIVEVTGSAVIGVMIVENGSFIVPAPCQSCWDMLEKTSEKIAKQGISVHTKYREPRRLDLRLSGWEFLYCVD